MVSWRRHMSLLFWANAVVALSACALCNCFILSMVAFKKVTKEFWFSRVWSKKQLCIISIFQYAALPVPDTFWLNFLVWKILFNQVWDVISASFVGFRFSNITGVSSTIAKRHSNLQVWNFDPHSFEQTLIQNWPKSSDSHENSYRPSRFFLGG